MRNLEYDKDVIEQMAIADVPQMYSETVALHAIDRAVAAEWKLDLAVDALEEIRDLSKQFTYPAIEVISEQTLKKIDLGERGNVDLTQVPSNQLKFELKMRSGPDWKCSNCGYYADGSGQWACPGCLKWHYFSGSMKTEDSQHYRDWKIRTAERYGMTVSVKEGESNEEKRPINPQTE